VIFSVRNSLRQEYVLGIVMAVKTRRTRWTGHVMGVEKQELLTRLWLENIVRKGHFGNKRVQ